MAQRDTYLTTEGLRALEEEIEHLRSVRRLEVAERIQGAKEPPAPWLPLRPPPSAQATLPSDCFS